MLKTFKAASALLSYPSAELQAAADEILNVIREEGLVGAAAIELLAAELAAADIYDLQERYVELFDRSRTLSLNLFEHVHGESRDRGPAMVDLLETYRAGGFEPATSELPDSLPVLLEFLACRPLGEAVDILADTAHILTALQTRLERRHSAYAGVFALLLDVVEARQGVLPPESREALDALLAEADEDPNDLARLDEVWAETQVTFGPDPNAGCPATRDLLGRMAVPVTPHPEAAEAAK